MFEQIQSDTTGKNLKNWGTAISIVCNNPYYYFSQKKNPQKQIGIKHSIDKADTQK